MTYLRLLPLTAFAVNIFIWGYLFAQRRTDRVYVLYHHLVLCLAAWSLTDFLLWSGFVPDPYIITAARIQSAVWIPLGAFLLGFIYKFMGRPRDPLLIGIYGLSLMFILLSLTTPLVVTGYHHSPWGISQEFGPLLLPLMLLVFLVPFAAAIWHMSGYMASAGDRNRQLELVLWGTSLSLLIGLVFNVGLGHIAGIETVQLGSSGSIILNVFILQAILRYNFMAVDTGQLEIMFRHLFENVADGIIIADSRGKILQVNRTARDMFCLDGPRDHLPAFSRIVPEWEDIGEMPSIGIARQDREGQEHSFVLSRSEIPFTDAAGCHLIMIRDLTDLKRSESYLQESARKIRQQSKFNRLRAQIWRIAGEKELSEEQLIQKLLDIIGPELGVSRACFNQVQGDVVVCILEWRRPDAVSTIGTKASFSMLRYLLKKELQTVNLENALERIPALVRPVARKILETMVRQQDIDSISYIPYYIDNQVKGLLSFDVCRNLEVKPVWNEERKAVVYDLVKIISQSTANKRMERSIREARDTLESRVQERTAELEDLNIRLSGSLKEKEVLLKEVHHRVKNNLQTIISLLALQSRHITDPRDRELFRDCQTRVRSISIIHERLYRSPDLAKVDFAQYTARLVRELQGMYGVEPVRVRVDLQVDDVRIGVDNAIPCGMIISELVTNAFKYAFPENHAGTLRIVLAAGEGGMITLEVADDGVGLPEKINFDTEESFGLQLVKTLADQLEGTVEVKRGSGTAFTIRFKG